MRVSEISCEVEKEVRHGKGLDLSCLPLGPSEANCRDSWGRKPADGAGGWDTGSDCWPACVGGKADGEDQGPLPNLPCLPGPEPKVQVPQAQPP